MFGQPQDDGQATAPTLQPVAKDDIPNDLLTDDSVAPAVAPEPTSYVDAITEATSPAATAASVDSQPSAPPNEIPDLSALETPLSSDTPAPQADSPSDAELVQALESAPTTPEVAAPAAPETTAPSTPETFAAPEVPEQDQAQTLEVPAGPVDSSTTVAADEDGLLEIKQQALQELQPLVDQLDQTPEEKFRTTMMMIQASDNANLIKTAYEAAGQITDEKVRAQALLDVVNEINYFTHLQDETENSQQ